MRTDRYGNTCGQECHSKESKKKINPTVCVFIHNECET